ncbi:MAG: hypothetical protein AAGG08_10705 [Actinomycetota bacterium]
MTAHAEDRLRRALDDVLTTCWAEDIPVLDAVTESIEDWAALVGAEFNDFRPPEETDGPVRLVLAISTLRSAVYGFPPGETTAEAVLSDALADWVREFGRI